MEERHTDATLNDSAANLTDFDIWEEFKQIVDTAFDPETGRVTDPITIYNACSTLAALGQLYFSRLLTDEGELPAKGEVEEEEERREYHGK